MNKQYLVLSTYFNTCSNIKTLAGFPHQTHTSLSLSLLDPTSKYPPNLFSKTSCEAPVEEEGEAGVRFSSSLSGLGACCHGARAVLTLEGVNRGRGNKVAVCRGVRRSSAGSGRRHSLDRLARLGSHRFDPACALAVSR